LAFDAMHRNASPLALALALALVHVAASPLDGCAPIRLIE
jgi:hypothetical protein